VTVTAISAFTTGPKVAPRSAFTARHGPRSLWLRVCFETHDQGVQEKFWQHSATIQCPFFAALVVRENRGTLASPSFETASKYDAAKGVEFPTTDRSRSALPGTWRWLCVHYFAECADYKRLDARTQHVRRQILEGTFDEPIAPKSDRFFRDFPLAKMNANAVEVLRDRKLSTPEAANGRVKAMRQVLKWGVAKGHAPFNPAREVPYFKSGSEGFHTWTPEEVQQFEERHPIGTKARLALALLIYTGQRRSDVIRFGKQHARGGKLTLRNIRAATVNLTGSRFRSCRCCKRQSTPRGAVTLRSWSMIGAGRTPMDHSATSFGTGVIKLSFTTVRRTDSARRARQSQQTTARLHINSWQSLVGTRSKKQKSTLRRPINNGSLKARCTCWQFASQLQRRSEVSAG
jgi:integrase